MTGHSVTKIFFTKVIKYSSHIELCDQVKLNRQYNRKKGYQLTMLSDPSLNLRLSPATTRYYDVAVVKTALFFGVTPRMFSGQCSTFVGGIEDTFIYHEVRHLSRTALRITQLHYRGNSVFPRGKAAGEWR